MQELIFNEFDSHIANLSFSFLKTFTVESGLLYMKSQNRSIFWWPVKLTVVAEVASLSIHDPHYLQEEVSTNDYGSLSYYFPDYLTRYYNPVSPS